MKNIKWSNIIFALCYIGAGVYFIMNPYILQEEIGGYFGFVLIGIGLVKMISYFVRSNEDSFFRNDFSNALIFITVGIIGIIYKIMFSEVIYIIIGIVVMVSGYNKLQDCVDTWRFGSQHGLLYLILAMISLALGVVIVVDPFADMVVFHYVVGGSLVYSGVSDLFSSIYLSGKMIGLKRRERRERDEEEKELEEENRAREDAIRAEAMEEEKERMMAERKEEEKITLVNLPGPEATLDESEDPKEENNQ